MIDLTPLEVRKKKSDFRRVMRGYDPALVDDFLDLVADRLDQLVRDNLTLAERSSRHEQQINEFRERERALTEALVTAQEMREEIRRQSAREAELARQAAEQESSQLRASVKQEVAQSRATAEQEVAQLRSTAEQEVSQLRSRAAQEVAQLRAEAQQEAQVLRSTARQEREREEDLLRQVRSQQQQFFASYRAMLERAMTELNAAAQSFGVPTGGQASLAGPTRSGWQEARGRGLAAAGARPAEPLAEDDLPSPHAQASGAVGGAAAAMLGGLAAAAATAAAGPAGGQDGLVGEEPLTDEEMEVLNRLDALVEEAAAEAAGQVTVELEEELIVLETSEAELEAAPWQQPEPFEPEPFAAEPFEPEPFEPEPFVAEESGPEPTASADLPALEDDFAADGGLYGASPAASHAEPEPRAGFGPFGGLDEEDIDIDAVLAEAEEALADAEAAALAGLPEPSGEADEELELYDELSAEPEPEAGVPGAIGLGGDLTAEPAPSAWSSASSWGLEGIDLVDSSLAADAPLDEMPLGDTPLEDSPEADEDASQILRNAAAAGYLPSDELLLDDILNDEDGDEGDGWLPTLLEDDK